MAEHRARVMELIQEARGDAGRSLCVLGPGNGNDVELGKLITDFETISLVDLDEEAVGRALGRLDEDARPRVVLHSPVDLSGVLAELEQWRQRRPTDGDISAVMRAARVTPRPEVGAFDVVASTCILTQIIDSVYMSLPESHPQRMTMAMAVRDRHLEILLELLKPGGVGVLVTDFAVADSAGALAPLGKLVLSGSSVDGMRQREFFAGTDPFEIRDYFNRLQGLGPVAGDAQVCGPWTWFVGGRELAVCAVVARRSAERAAAIQV